MDHDATVEATPKGSDCPHTVAVTGLQVYNRLGRKINVICVDGILAVYQAPGPWDAVNFGAYAADLELRLITFNEGSGEFEVEAP